MRGRTRVGLTLDDESRAAIRDLAGEEIGFIDFARDREQLAVRWIELDEGRRRWGLGMDAVRLMEAEASRRWGVREARAEVPISVGLALYFWLRLGYRPAEPVRDELDTMSMVRDLKEQEHDS